MPYIVRVPGLGMQEDQATLIEWHVDPGKQVEEGDILASLETEKTVLEVEASEDGVLRRIYAEVGESREPNEPLGIIAGPDDDISSLESSVEEVAVTQAGGAATGTTDATEATTGASPRVADSQVRVDETMGTERGRDDTSEDRAETTRDRRISPRARKRADELGVDLDELRDFEDPVTADDVAAAAQETGSDAAGQPEDSMTESEGNAQPSMPGRITPRARKRAEELNVNLVDIEGTGPGGAVTESDVRDAVDTDVGTVTGDIGRTVREERSLIGMRQTIASRLEKSYQEAVHVTIDRAANAEPLFSAVETCKQDLRTDVSLLDLLLVALSRSLEKHPIFNATFEEETLRIYEEHNIGVAVDMDRGLVTPVLEAVNERSLTEVAIERSQLTERVLADEFETKDLEGGTFTVTNLGPFGVESFDPIINPPQVAILGVNEVREQPVRSEKDRGQFRFRRELPLSLSFDHSVVDGADAARFLETLVEYLEQPDVLLPDSVDHRDRQQATTDPLERADGDEKMPERSLSADVDEGLAGTVRGGSFEWSFDEPVDMGGSGAAPTPVDYFLGSLAACLAASVKFQADKRDLAVNTVEVNIKGEPETGTTESVTVIVGVRSSIDDNELAELVELGERGCHVTSLLREDLSVEVSWKRTPAP